jgi:hypothetical protein
MGVISLALLLLHKDERRGRGRNRCAAVRQQAIGLSAGALKSTFPAAVKGASPKSGGGGGAA